MNDFEIITVSSLEKVFPSDRPSLYENANSCFKNEVFSFQAAYFHAKREFMLQFCSCEVSGSLKNFVSVRMVCPAPCTTPRSSSYDDYYLTHTAALVPEILKDDGLLYVRFKEWGALWFTVKGDLPVGLHEIIIAIKDGEGNELGCTKYMLTVLDNLLPKSHLKYANWFHYDSLAEYYGLEVFSEQYNTVMWDYISNAVSHGVNTLLIPLFTTPLNVGKGLEKTTAQLVDISVSGGKYVFDFNRLRQFLKKANEMGITNFEMSHLYTQWGAEHPPKIMATVEGKSEQIFGWSDLALGDSYVAFIKQFLLELTAFLKQENYGTDCCYFHISDEPNANHLQHYHTIREIIKPILGEYKIFDALSNYDFYKTGAVDIAIVTTDEAQTFIDNNIDIFWVYYCCGQGFSNLSNRFMSMPLQRIRILGFQLYLTNAKGFLQWGYNFYNTALSERYINPYETTDAGGSFQSGDSFIVYPSPKLKPYDSIRHEVMYDAFQDYRALLLLEEKIGRNAVVAFLNENNVQNNYTHYPKSAQWHTEFRRKINTLICK